MIDIKNNLIIRFLILCLVIGFPRLFGTNVPLMVFLIPFFLIGIINFYSIKLFLTYILFLFFWALFGINSYFLFESNISDLAFHFQIIFKLILCFFSGYIVFKVLEKNTAPLVMWIVFQLTLMSLAAFIPALYDFLLNFISPSSANVFKHIYGLRVIGFGLFHVDGAITLVTAVFSLSILYSRNSISNIFHVIVLPLSMAMARSSIVAYLIYFSLKKGVTNKLIIFIFILFMILFSFFVSEGPLYEATEIFRNLIVNSNFESNSLTHLKSMYIFPSNIWDYIFGEGFYFDKNNGNLYFKEIDVGFLRVLYFGGLIYLALYFLMHTYHLKKIYIDSKNRRLKFFSLFFFLLFIVLQLKGIQGMSIFSFVLFNFHLHWSKYAE